jgi:hypothetical protein
LYLWFKEEEFFNIEDKDLSKIGIINTNRVFSKLDELFWIKRRPSAFCRVVFNHIRDITTPKLFYMLSRWILKQYVQKGVRKDIEMSFSLWEKYTEGIFDLSLSGGQLMFKFLDEASNAAAFRVYRRVFKQMRIGQSKECKDLSILFIGLRGVVSTDKLEEPVNQLWVNDISVDIVRDEEIIQRDVESSRGFHHNNWLGQGSKQIEQLRETFTRHGTAARGDNFHVFIKHTKMELFLRDVNTYVVFHSATSLSRNFLSLTPSSHVAGAFSSPTNLLGVEGQRDRLLWGLKSPGSMESLSLINFSNLCCIMEIYFKLNLLQEDHKCIILNLDQERQKVDLLTKKQFVKNSTIGKTMKMPDFGLKLWVMT